MLKVNIIFIKEKSFIYIISRESLFNDKISTMYYTIAKIQLLKYVIILYDLEENLTENFNYFKFNCIKFTTKIMQ